MMVRCLLDSVKYRVVMKVLYCQHSELAYEICWLLQKILTTLAIVELKIYSICCCLRFKEDLTDKERINVIAALWICKER